MKNMQTKMQSDITRHREARRRVTKRGAKGSVSECTYVDVIVLLKTCIVTEVTLKLACIAIAIYISN